VRLTGIFEFLGLYRRLSIVGWPFPSFGDQPMLDMYIYVLFIGTIVAYEELLIMHASFYSLGSTIIPSYYNNKFQFLQLACRVISAQLQY